MRPSEILERLINFVEDPEEVDLLSREEVRIALAEEGYDPEVLTARLKERLVELKARREPATP